MKEADLKLAIEDYLQYGMNQGKWYFDRLNSGSLLTKRGQSTYRVNLCREGTADFMVIKGTPVDKLQWATYDEILGTTHCELTIPRLIFLELKGEKGKQRPEQGAFQKLVEAQGAEYHIIRLIEELEAVLSDNI